MRNVCVDMQGNHPLLMPFPDIQSVFDYANGSLGNITPTAQSSQKAPGVLWSHKALKVIITINFPSRKTKLILRCCKLSKTISGHFITCYFLLFVTLL